METIGQVTVDDSGNVAIPNDICAQLGFTPGERLLVEKGSNGEARLAPADNLTQAVEVGVAEESLGKIIDEAGVLVIAFDTTEPLPESVSAWLKDPVKYDREMRMKEIMRGSGLESLD